MATIPNQMNYTWNNKDIPFIGTIDDSIHMIGIATRAQQYQNKQDNPRKNQSMSNPINTQPIPPP